MSKNKVQDVSIEEAYYYLLRNEPFYGVFVQPMLLHTSTDVPLAGVNIKNGKVNLYINPYSWNDLSTREQAAVLMHEMDHVALDHIGRFSQKARSVEEASKDSTQEKSDEDKLVDEVVRNIKAGALHKRANWACDLAINEHIANLPKKMNLYDKEGAMLGQGDLLFVDKMKQQFPDMEKFKHADYYLDFLKDEAKKSSRGRGDGEKDEERDAVSNHDIWDEGDDVDPDTVREICKQALSKAIEQTSETGKIPSHVQRAWAEINKPHNNWRSILRKFCARAKSSEVEDTRKRRNRRYGTLLPGYKVKDKLKIVVGVDSSGSITDELIQKFMTEIHGVHRAGADVTMVVCDAEIHSVEEFNPRRKHEVKGGGGTLYQPIFDKASELDCDALVIFGDGFCADSPMKPKFPVLWALSEGGRSPVEWGMKLKVE